jgi:hypothetical protein
VILSSCPTSHDSLSLLLVRARLSLVPPASRRVPDSILILVPARELEEKDAAPFVRVLPLVLLHLPGICRGYFLFLPERLRVSNS